MQKLSINTSYDLTVLYKCIIIIINFIIKKLSSITLVEIRSIANRPNLKKPEKQPTYQNHQ